MRWDGREQDPSVGNPESRGNATWFILPKELETVVLDEIDVMNQTRLVDGYTEMARDREREQEAGEWVEGLIGDASTQR